MGTYSKPFLTSFRQLVLAVAESEAPNLEAPPSVRQKNKQLAASLLSKWGLDPSSVARAERAKPLRDPNDPLNEFTPGEL